MKCLPENCARHVSARPPLSSLVRASCWRVRLPGAPHSCWHRPLPSSDMVSSSAVLTTPRLLLRKFGAEDAARLPQLSGAFEVSGYATVMFGIGVVDELAHFLTAVSCEPELG